MSTRSRERSNLIKQMFSGEVVLPFFVGWILLGLMTSAGYSLLTYAFGDRWPVFAAIFVLSGVVLFCIYLVLERHLRRSLSVEVSAQIGEDTMAASHRALVVLVGPGSDGSPKPTHVSAVEYQLKPEVQGPPLEHVWYVYTPESEAAGRLLRER